MLLLFISLAYLLGSIPSAIVICRFVGLPDPRQYGSGNPGASNMLRLAGKWLACLVLLGDSLKAVLPLIGAKAAGIVTADLGWIALFAFLGHVFPVFFKFQGGKGVATALGSLWVIAWSVALLALMVWLIVLLWQRYISLASITATTISLIAAIWLAPMGTYPAILLMGALLIERHHANIQRLIKGTEHRLRFR